MPDSKQIPNRSPTTRSRVANGSSLFVDSSVDGRTKEARRFRDVLAEIVSDLGGLDQLSEGQRQLARRCTLLAVECEKLEGEVIAGASIDLDAYGKLCDRMGRAFQRLGLKRVSKDVTPDPLVEHFKRPFRGAE